MASSARTWIRRLLWNAEERRPRALWRLLLSTVLLVGFVFAVSVTVFRFRPASPPPLVRVGFVAAQGLTFVAAVYVAGRVLDRRRFSDFGFRLDTDWWVDFGFGLALGAGLMTAIFLVELAAGWVRVTGWFQPPRTFLPNAALVFALFLSVGVYEELVARGYVLTNVAEGLSGYLSSRGSAAVAVVVSSAVFGGAHASNPNATLVSTLAVSFAGVMLASGYVLTGELSVPVGLHVTWNVFQGVVYGFPVSGMRVDAAVVAVEQGGPSVVTGGQFGPEAGLLGIAAILVGTAATVAWVRYRYGPESLAVHPALTAPDLRWR